MSKILKFELWGMVFISLSGSLLHFTFNWLNRFWLAGAFSAVNESTWEHLKLAVVPAFIWALVENRALRGRPNNFWFAKAAGIYAMPVLIIAFFYGYKAILGHNLLAIDISIFVAAVILGQLLSYSITKLPGFSRKFDSCYILLLVALVLSFVVFTFWPPHFFLWQDPISGGYGIIK